MAARRKLTERGMGAVRKQRSPGSPSGVDFAEEATPGTHGLSCPEPRENPVEDPRPLPVRDTMPAPAMPPEATESGARKLFTKAFARQSTPVDMAMPAIPVSVAPSSVAPQGPGSAPPASAPPSGRYSSQPVDDLGVDQVGVTTIVAAHDGALTGKPRLLDRQRISELPLTARQAFVLALIDGSLTVQDIIDAAGMPEREIREILAYLVRLGTVAV
jgi:hypothetical protein